MAPRTSSALWLKPPFDAEIREEELASPRVDQLVIRTHYTAISRGTETLIYRGEVPESEYERVRAPFQAGTLPNPVKLGYANAGVVEHGPREWIGTTVFCLGPHQTRLIMDCEDVVPLPADIPPERAVLAANLETAINAVWDAGVTIGDRISVIGAGVLGTLTAWLCARIPGTTVQLLDTDSRKAFLGSTLGVDFAVPSNALTERDRVFHTSATSDGLACALDIAGLETQIIEMSWYGTTSVEAGLGGAFHARRLALKSSQVGRLPETQRARWTPSRRLKLAVSLLSDDTLDVLFEPDQPFRALPLVMQRLANRDDPALCQRIVYDPDL